LDRLVKVGQLLVGVAALLTAMFLIWTNVLKPGPAPAVLGASVNSVEVFPDTTFRSYVNGHPGQLSRAVANARAAGLDPREVKDLLQTEGILVEYSVGIDGVAGQAVNVTRTLYDAGTQERVPADGLVVVPPERLVSQAASDQRAQDTWMSLPPSPGTYFVEIDVVSINGETIGKGRSHVFSVRG
jgi:hypothetical protein